MAELLQDGSIKMRDGRILWGRDIVQIIDICELAELLAPTPKSVGGVRGFGSGGGGGFGGGGGGGRGAKGDPGPAGAVGPQGIPGPPGGPDIYAATRIVSLIPGDGTDLTIAAAIAALPAAGGLIFVKQGTYPISASLFLTDKPIDIVGAGGSTILDMGASAISLFTKSFRHRYKIANLTVVGTGIAGQAFFEDTIGDGVFSVDVEGVTIDQVQTGFISGAGALSLRLVRVSYTPSLSAAAQFFTGIVGSNLIEATLTVVVGGTVNGFVEIVATVCHFDFTQASGPVVNFVSGMTVAACSISGEFSVSGGRPTQISGCSFSYGVFGIPPNRYLDLAVAGGFPAVISGNNFTLPANFEEILNAGDLVFIQGNTGLADLPIVTETGAANNNRYQDISLSSTILGNATILNGENSRTIAANVTLNETHRTVLIDASAAPRTVALPPAAAARDRVYTIKKRDSSANLVTIDPAGGETVDGFALQLLTTQYQALRIQSDGIEWWII